MIKQCTNCKGDSEYWYGMNAGIFCDKCWKAAYELQKINLRKEDMVADVPECKCHCHNQTTYQAVCEHCQPIPNKKDVWEEEFDNIIDLEETDGEVSQREVLRDFIRTNFISKSHLKEQIKKIAKPIDPPYDFFGNQDKAFEALKNTGYAQAILDILKLIS